MTLLRVENLVKSFPTGYRSPPVTVVKGVSFTLDRGEILGLVGESGSGKSTTARCVARLLPADSGRVVLDGRDVLGASGRELRSLRRDMQMVFQDPYSSLNPRMPVGEAVSEPLLVHGLVTGRAALRRRALELLRMVGLEEEHLDRYPRSFSGGQRQRIAIARAIALEPKLLICDEPVSSLDVSVQAQVLNLFHDLRERLGLTILFIAHDLAVVRHLCDRVAVMRGGEIVEIADSDTLYDNPTHEYTRSLLAAVPIPDPRRERARRGVGTG
jgi:ABC-type oligopeptide transport system ATPase subunit